MFGARLDARRLHPRAIKACSILFWAFFVVLTIVNVGLFYRTLSPYGLCHRDLHQDYLQALALRDNLDPFLSLEKLARRYSPECENRFFPHASPHTLTQLLITLPLSHLGEWWLSLIWLLISFGAFLFSLFRLRSITPFLDSRRRFWGAFLILFTSQPVSEELWLGQVNLVILALVTEAFIRIGGGRLNTGGALLGFSLALKPLAWLLVPFLLVRRPRAGVIAVASFGMFQLINAAFFGLDTVVRYYRDVSVGAVSWWSPNAGNTSILRLLERIYRDGGVMWFIGAVEPVAHSLTESLTRLSVVLGVAGLALIWGLRGRTLEGGWCRVLVLSPILLPLAWIHYLVVYIPVFAFLYERTEDSHRGCWMFWLAFSLWWLSASMVGDIAFESGIFSDRYVGLLQLIPPIGMVYSLVVVGAGDRAL